MSAVDLRRSRSRHPGPCQHAPLPCSGLSIDTRTLEGRRSVRGAERRQRDGHDFVDAAFDAKAGRGAGQPHAVTMRKGPLLTVADTQRGLEDLARAARARSNARILAVTGSAGKTTTKEILRALPATRWAARMPRPPPTTIIGACRCSLASLPRDAEYGVFEVGMNHFGEIRNLVGFVRPHVALITTIAPAHLEFFGTCEAIADAKSEIFEGLVPGGAALIPVRLALMPSVLPRARRRRRSAALCAFGSNGRGASLLSIAPDGEGMRVKADILGRGGGLPGRRARRAYRHECGGGAGGGGAGGRRCAERGGGAEEFHGAEGPRRALRGARRAGDRRKLQRQSRFHGGGAGAAGPSAKGRKIAVLGDMLEMGEGGPASCRRWSSPSKPPTGRSGLRLRPADEGAVGCACPRARRGAYAENSADAGAPAAGGA